MVAPDAGVLGAVDLAEAGVLEVVAPGDAKSGAPTPINFSFLVKSP